MTLTGLNESIRDKHVKMSLCPLRTSHGLAQDYTKLPPWRNSD